MAKRPSHMEKRTVVTARRRLGYGPPQMFESQLALHWLFEQIPWRTSPSVLARMRLYRREQAALIRTVGRHMSLAREQRRAAAHENGEVRTRLRERLQRLQGEMDAAESRHRGAVRQASMHDADAQQARAALAANGRKLLAASAGDGRIDLGPPEVAGS